MRGLIIFIATGGYAGYFPIASGTAGAAIGLVLGWLFFAPLWRHSATTFILVFAPLFIAGCFIAGAAEKIFAESDSSYIVLDEIFGMIATMFLNPTTFLSLTVGFLLFRLFDIIKPWPASRFDRMHNGFGVMLDDLASGVYANLVLQTLRRVF